MIYITLPDSSGPGWLALYPPEMSAAPAMRVKSKVYTDRGATGREARRPSDPTLCVELDWQAELAAGDVTAMRDALLAYQNEPIVMPCWPLVVAGRDYIHSTTPQGGYMIAWNESGSYSFYTGAVPSPTAWDWIAPAIYGNFADLPRAGASQGDFVRYSFKFVEDSPAAWALGPFNTALNAAGPALSGYTPPGFPFALDWAQSVESGAAGVSVTRDQIGPGRQTLQTFYPNVAERQVRGQFTAFDPWPLICWWASQGGPAQSQWLSTGLSAGLLTADAAAGASAVTMSHQSGVAPGAILAFTIGDTIFYSLVSSVSGATVNLSAVLPANCPAASTVVSVAMLGRHFSDTLEIEWVSPDNFSAKLDWVELAAEYSIAGGETRGSTIGRKAGRPYLLEISTTQPVAEVLLRITDWSVGVTSGGNFYTPFQLDVGDRNRDIDLSSQQLQIVLPWVTGSPLANFLPGSSYRRLFAKLFYVPVAADGTVGAAVQDWYGEIVDLEYEGPKLTIQVSGPSSVFDRQVPGDQYGKTCNAHLFDTRCGVDKSAWTVTGTLVSTTGNQLVFNTASRPGGAMTPLQAAGAFQLGAVQWVVGGVTKSAGIYGSSYAAGSYTLTMRDTVTITPGTTLTIIPGCDLQWLGGCARYSGKFRGFPYVPIRAPQFILPTAQTSSGKK